MNSILMIPVAWLWGKVFRFQPKIGKEGGRLVARSGYRFQIFTLGAFRHEVIVDPRLRRIDTRSRIFWFGQRHRMIRFEEVMDVLYGYRDVSMDSSWSLDGYRENDLFTVGLRFVGGKELTLFRFYGGGSFVNNGPFPDWCYWEEQILDWVYAGDEESQSQMFADVIGAMVGVPVSNPMP